MPDALHSISSAYAFDGWVRRAIHAFKYEGERARARHLGDLLAPLLPDDHEADVTVPVPLHPSRLKERGYNQALLLAQRLAAAHDGLAVVEIVRSRSTAPQVDLPSSDRRANVAGAFSVPQPNRIVGRRVVLVDDVITTTSTMTACAAALADAGAASIRCISVARAV